MLAQFHGNKDLAWYAGVATLQNADGSCRIQYEDGDVEDLRVAPPGHKLPCIKHFDGSYVQSPPQDSAGHGGSRRTKKHKPRKPTTVHHAGFQFMRIDPAPPAAVDASDDLAGRIHFSYKEEKVRTGTVTVLEVKYVTLRDIVLEANADIARMQQQAFVDFLTHLYTTPPVSAENIKHMLGPQVMEGWTPSERKRVDRNFKVFKRAQVQEEEKNEKWQVGEACDQNEKWQQRGRGGSVA